MKGVLYGGVLLALDEVGTKDTYGFDGMFGHGYEFMIRLFYEDGSDFVIGIVSEMS